MPHGHCYLWKPSLVWTMVISDALIGLAYVSISASLYWLVRKIKLPFSAMFVAFGIFILACGATHFMEIFNLWYPRYWDAAFVKVVTATASVVTAIYMFPVAPKVMGLAKTVELSELQGQQLQIAYSEMEARVRERTKDLEATNAALRMSEERLGRALQVREDFLSIASHELKTPLSSLRLQVELAGMILSKGDLGESADAAKLKKMSKVSERQIERMSALIEDLLDVSRIQAGKLQLNREDTDLGEVAHEVVERLTGLFHNVGAQLILEAQGSFRGHWDRSRLDQVFVNLLTNAAKYAPGKPVHVTLSPDGEDHVLVQVRDQGPGVPVENRERVFNRFERAEASRNIGGLGLGLYITRQIVEMHGGRIWVEGEPGDGATFLVRLPQGK